MKKNKTPKKDKEKEKAEKNQHNHFDKCTTYIQNQVLWKVVLNNKGIDANVQVCRDKR